MDRRSYQVQQCRGEEAKEINEHKISRLQSQNRGTEKWDIRHPTSPSPYSGQDKKEKGSNCDQPGEESCRRVVLAAQKQKRCGKTPQNREQQAFESFHLPGFK